MKKIALVIMCAVLYCTSNAQSPCPFETLFTIKPGMTKAEVTEGVKRLYQLAQIKDVKEDFRPPYIKAGTPSIRKEVITYRIDSGSCFNGRNTFVRFEFADDKLYKAYISTSFNQQEYANLLSNFEALRKSILQSWKYEKGIKIDNKDLKSTGYTYTKTKSVELKPNTVTLQYVQNLSPTSATQNAYTLEVIWANLVGTRLEGAVY